MKTFRTITMMIALTVIATVTHATGNLRVNILPLTAERAVVAISNDAKSKFEISIEDSRGGVVYYKETEGDMTDYRKIYDFSNLETGNYTLVVSINGVTNKRAFSINHSEISVGKGTTLTAPFFSYKKGILRLAYLNQTGDNMKLNIYSDGDLIYSKALENTFSVNEGLDLSKLSAGNYQVVLDSGDETYNYTVAVD